jgi:UDP-N-acetylmuramyl pentapeptide synthase
MIRESVEIHAPEVALANAIRFRGLGRFPEEEVQFRVELVRELRPCHILVVIHDARDVRGNLLVEFQAHQLRRLWI